VLTAAQDNFAFSVNVRARTNHPCYDHHALATKSAPPRLRQTEASRSLSADAADVEQFGFVGVGLYPSLGHKLFLTTIEEAR
jgi:hypothetical protein